MNKFDIIIPTFNQELFTVKCLESIRAYTKNYKIIWVDNGSTEQSRNIVMTELKNHKNYLSIWFEKNQGFVKAINAGIRASNSEYIILQNNDTEVTYGWLNPMLCAMNSDENIMCCGPLTDTEGSWQGWKNVKNKMLNDMEDMTGWNSTKISNYLREKYDKKYVHVNMVAFFCTLFRRSIFKKIGLLDEVFSQGLGDDDDYCNRIRNDKGFVIFVPASFVYHHHRTTFKSIYSLEEIQKMQTVNLNIYKKKHGIIK